MRAAPPGAGRRSPAPRAHDSVTCPRSCALPQRLDLFAIHELLQGALTTGLPVAAAVLEGDHWLPLAPGFGRTLGAVPGAPSTTCDRARAVQVRIERKGRVHLEPVPSKHLLNGTADRFRASSGHHAPARPPRTGSQGGP